MFAGQCIPARENPVNKWHRTLYIDQHSAGRVNVRVKYCLYVILDGQCPKSL